MDDMDDMDGWIVVGRSSVSSKSSSMAVELQQKLLNRRPERELRRRGILKTRSDGTARMRFFGRKQANSSKSFERQSVVCDRSRIDQLRTRRSKSASPAAIAKIQVLLYNIAALKTVQQRLRSWKVPQSACVDVIPGKVMIGALQKRNTKKKQPKSPKWIIGALCEENRQQTQNHNDDVLPGKVIIGVLKTHKDETSNPKMQWIKSALAQRNFPSSTMRYGTVKGLLAWDSAAVAQSTPTTKKNDTHSNCKEKKKLDNQLACRYHYTQALFDFVESEQAP